VQESECSQGLNGGGEGGEKRNPTTQEGGIGGLRNEKEPLEEEKIRTGEAALREKQRRGRNVWDGKNKKKGYRSWGRSFGKAVGTCLRGRKRRRTDNYRRTLRLERKGGPRIEGGSEAETLEKTLMGEQRRGCQKFPDRTDSGRYVRLPWRGIFLGEGRGKTIHTG